MDRLLRFYPLRRTVDVLRNADVAQLVEHHLAKVRVAGSSPVIRSQSGIHSIPLGVVGWPRGEAAACKAVYTGSNPVPTSGDWRRGSALPSHGRGHWFDPSIAHQSAGSNDPVFCLSGSHRSGGSFVVCVAVGMRCWFLLLCSVGVPNGMVGRLGERRLSVWSGS